MQKPTIYSLGERACRLNMRSFLLIQTDTMHEKRLSIETFNVDVDCLKFHGLVLCPKPTKNFSSCFQLELSMLVLFWCAPDLSVPCNMCNYIIMAMAAAFPMERAIGAAATATSLKAVLNADQKLGCRLLRFSLVALATAVLTKDKP